MKRASLLTLTLIGAFSAIQAAWAVDYPLPPTYRFPTPIIGVLNFVKEKIPQSYIRFLIEVPK